jgi:hypothetical protein
MSGKRRRIDSAVMGSAVVVVVVDMVSSEMSLGGD